MNIAVGDVFSTNTHGRVTVVAYHRCSNIEVMFEDGVVVSCSSAALRGGRLRNPMQPHKGSVGFVGIGRYTPKDHKASYKIWYAMFERCYKASVQRKHPSYVGCSVSEDWHNYQNFAEFYENHAHRYEGWELDKDILICDNRVYSKETCCFVPKEINNMFQMGRKSESGFTGVYFESSSQKYIATAPDETASKRNLGRFDTVQEASRVRTAYKDAYIRRLAEKWRGLLQPEVYNKLVDWGI